ncbi:uncharacterized protein LOC143302242 [Babylonia areolata]|uniref:uncharacterized protein LOC143302242 n=1 Tax=Babylonia areolata TaxID=304850 RepID=UPI003FD2824B
MAASLVRSRALGAVARKTFALRTGNVCQTWTRTAFFRRRKDQEESSQATDKTLDESQLVANTQSIAASNTLRKRQGIQTVRGYKPPADVEIRVQKVVSEVCGNVGDLNNVKLDNNRIKFKVLDGAMREFDHFIPNSQLANMKTASDVLAFFSTPVYDTTSYEDLSKLDLPPNLHIQLEPLRFDPETDTMCGGVSAFPDRPTVVSSLKFKRKYGKTEK